VELQKTFGNWSEAVLQKFLEHWSGAELQKLGDLGRSEVKKSLKIVNRN